MKATSTPYLLISDLDDTLVGDPKALRHFQDFMESEEGEQITLIYASGRLTSSIRDLVFRTDLPEPVYVIGGAGSEICEFKGSAPLEGWEERMSENWSAETVRECLKDLDEIKLQAEENQSAFKVSYLYPNASQEHLDRIKSHLSEAGIQTSFIYSSRRDLDILPEGVDKGSAAAYLADRLGFEASQVITAGNSGNDLKLLQHGFHGVVVANAHSELRERTKRNPRVYFSAQGFADGVLDGLRHWIERLTNDHEA